MDLQRSPHTSPQKLQIYYPALWQKDSADVDYVKDIEMRRQPRISRWGQYNQKCPYKKKKAKESELEEAM